MSDEQPPREAQRRQRTPVELKALNAAERSGRPFLTMMPPDQAEQIIMLPRDTWRLTIGRNPESDIAISSKSSGSDAGRSASSAGAAVAAGAAARDASAAGAGARPQTSHQPSWIVPPQPGRAQLSTTLRPSAAGSPQAIWRAASATPRRAASARARR